MLQLACVFDHVYLRQVCTKSSGSEGRVVVVYSSREEEISH